MVIAIEPDHENVALLRRNLAPYGERARVLHAGLWPTTATLAIDAGSYRDGRQWSRQVRETSESIRSVPGLDIPTILAQVGDARVSLLKIDIEGAEAMVFAGRPSWLERIDAIAIELHDDSRFGPASEVFFSAIEGQGFNLRHSGELTLCERARAG